MLTARGYVAVLPAYRLYRQARLAGVTLSPPQIDRAQDPAVEVTTSDAAAHPPNAPAPCAFLTPALVAGAGQCHRAP
jgi:hypothetical protein